jgi:2-dehydropantoate 2-reductase
LPQLLQGAPEHQGGQPGQSLIRATWGVICPFPWYMPRSIAPWEYMAKITIIGPGAIGGTIGAWLAQDPRHRITLAARTRLDGLQVQTPHGVISAQPLVLTEPAQATPVDWVLIATKAYDVVGASRWLECLCRPDTLVAVLQNGIEHIERFAPYLPGERIVPVMVDCPAERLGPGCIRQRGPARLVVPRGRSGEAFVNLFAHTPIEVSASADFRTEIWKKLCFNSAGALSAILLKGAVISRHEALAQLMRGVVRECLAVGRAEGARLDDSLVENVVSGYQAAPPDSVNSMHADRIAGRPMEIDARNGVIVRLGLKHGIPTPLNALLADLLEAAQG